ncbi:MAG: NUDIX hydrolase [candidate division KSB1 bacterium]|nr:NUDIX hydrolase [candidate division KSB1 bacterium]MDZ7366040.1 NUDIX hydrolase [candidate division KSB1 bacterium]MDZ7404157.1 NUDIX hydrolase [candidate division KSB1 bacterium]
MKYRFCPQCGSPLVLKKKSNGEQAYLTCSKCGFVHYNNPKPCVSAVIIRNGKVLLMKRAYEPFKNHWDYPGGFLESGENPQEGLRREVVEELKINVEIIDFLGIYPDTYGPEGDATLNIYYLCKISNGTIDPQAEVAEARWFVLNDLPQKLAFGHVKLVLDEWRKIERRNEPIFL